MNKVKSFFAKLYGLAFDACIENADGRARARRAYLVTGYINTVASAITTGTFFTALLLAMGAEDVFIGYVSIATTLCALVQYFSPLVWEKVPRRKGWLVGLGAFCNFITYVVVTVIPFLPTETGVKLGLYFAATLLTSILSNFTSPASGAWTIQNLPFEKRASYAALSTLPNTLLNIVSAFLASRFLDGVKDGGYEWGALSPELTAILILRIIAMVLVVISSIITPICVREYPYEKDPGSEGRGSFKMLLIPLKNKPFLMTILIPCLYTFSSAIIGNYFNVHLLQNVEMSYTMISLAQIISTPMVLLLTPLWALILRNHSWFRSFGWAFLGYCLAWLSNVFISATSVYFYFIAIVLGNVFAPCLSIVTGNLVYMKMPKATQTVFLSFYAILSSLSSVLGQLLGTMFVKFTGDLRFTLFGIEICNLQLTSAIAAAFGVGIAIYSFFCGRWFEREEKTGGDAF